MMRTISESRPVKIAVVTKVFLRSSAFLVVGTWLLAASWFSAVDRPTEAVTTNILTE